MSADPYRTLGLEPGASMAEVKRAYRRLAKAFHPDSAGEAALPRFLAIHEAYEALKTGRPAPSVRPSAAAQRGPEPWRADPARAREARERARTSRTGRGWRAAPGASSAASGSSRASSAAGTSGTSGGASGSAERGGSGRPHSDRSSGTTGPARPGRRKTTRKATLGSTSYDEARESTDATWSGASWYGPTSGEYWIINPREYADPRKHGPAYQSRARRAAAEAGDAADAAPEPADPLAADGEEVDLDPAADAGSGSGAQDGRPARDRPPGDSSTDTSPEGHGQADDRPRRARPVVAPPWERAPAGASAGAGVRGRWTNAAADAGDASWERRTPFRTVTREWLGGPTDDPIRRLGVALLAWPPIGLAAAAAIGDATGCSMYAANCGGTDSLLPWLAQAGILGLLLLLPPLARLLAAGTVAVMIALLPITAFLVAVGGSGQPQAGFALAFLLGAVWLAGVAWSVWTAARRDRGAGAGAEP